MKLLQRERETLLTAIMADVPQNDYHTMATTVVQTAALALCPQPVRLMWQNHETRHWLETAYINLPGSLSSVTIPAPRSYDEQREFTRKVLKDPAVVELCEGYEAQEKRLDTLRRELRANLEACNTHEVFRKRFPDLAGYLPELSKVTPTAMLPSTTALMDHLRASGLPLPKEVDTEMEAA